jgi:hypothetical protein
MGKDDRKKQEKQKEKEEYYKKVLGDPGTTLIDEDPAKQKKILVHELERISRLAAEDSSSAAVSADCAALLDGARALLKEEKPDAGAVLGKFDKVRQRLLQAYESRAAQPEWFPFITVLNLVYLAIIVLIIVLYQLIPGQKNLENSAFVCLACALWGGVGGVVDAFFALHTHFARQDFDRQYWPWYYFHPILGLSMGAVVFLVLQAGLLAISGMPLQEAAAANVTAASVQNALTANITAVAPAVAASGKIGVTALPIALAFLAGFRQRTAVDFLTRIVAAVFQKNGQTGSEQK